MTGRLRVGCSGYAYDDWRGRFYPAELARRGWFDSYAERFDTVELNTTFYRLPTAATVEDWRVRAPAGFCYALKLSRYGTHLRHLREPERWVPTFVERAERLGPSLGPILVQLPPRWRADPDRLDAFLRVAPSRLRWAVELRDPTWLCEDVYAVLRAHRAALCVHDLLLDHPKMLTAEWLYLRLHGPDATGHRYARRYGPEPARPLGRLASPAPRRRLGRCTCTSTTTSARPPPPMPWCCESYAADETAPVPLAGGRSEPGRPRIESHSALHVPAGEADDGRPRANLL